MGRKKLKKDPTTKQKAKNKKDSWFALLHVLCFILPVTVYVIFTCILFPGFDSGFLCLGIAGSIILGVGLMPVIGSLYRYPVNFPTVIICVIIGVVLIAISLLTIYLPNTYIRQNQAFLDFYFAVWAFMPIPGIWYFFFRSSIDRWLRERGNSKSKIDSLKKGWRNYWLYKSLQNYCNLGVLYHLNKVFIVLYLGALIIQSCFGWLRVASIPITIILCCIYFLCIVIWLFSARQWSLDEFGVSFFLFANNGKTKNWHGISWISLMAGMLLPILLFVAQIMLVTTLW